MTANRNLERTGSYFMRNPCRWLQIVLNMVACIRSTWEPTQLISPFLLFECVSSAPALYIKQKLQHDQRHEMTNDHIRRNESQILSRPKIQKRCWRKRLSSVGADLKSKIDRIRLTTNPARRPGERTVKTMTKRGVMWVKRKWATQHYFIQWAPWSFDSCS
jgi:hypothetical protein